MSNQIQGTILIVEDDRDIREIVATALHEEGYAALTAPNGEAALRVLREAPEVVDLILLDLMMPVMDGWEFRAHQREDERLRHIPVLILSAGGQVEKKAQNLGAVGWLKKPVQLGDLLGAVKASMLRGHSLKAGSPALRF
jgi:two-component system chemotaxis response regulator CheY